MLDDGLYKRFGKPDFALALHCNSTIPTGTVWIRGGYAMANAAPRVHEIADATAPHHAEDGVAQVLAALFRG